MGIARFRISLRDCRGFRKHGLLKIVADAREALIQQSELVNLMSGRREASNVEHRLIVEAIEAGSEADARAAMEAHLSKVKTAVTTIIGKDEV